MTTPQSQRGPAEWLYKTQGRPGPRETSQDNLNRSDSLSQHKRPQQATTIITTTTPAAGNKECHPRQTVTEQSQPTRTPTQPQQGDPIQELQRQLDIIIRNQQALERLQRDQSSSNQSDHASGHGSGTTSSSASLRKPKLQRPEPFDGSSEELRYWIVEFDEWLDNESLHDTKERASY